MESVRNWLRTLIAVIGGSVFLFAIENPLIFTVILALLLLQSMTPVADKNK